MKDKLEEIRYAISFGMPTNKVMTLIQEALTTQKAEFIKIIDNLRCEVPEEPKYDKRYEEEISFYNRVVKHAGRFNYNKALEDILAELERRG